MPETEIVGEAVLRDFPLRLWHKQREHTDEMLRVFTLLVLGEHQQAGAGSAPRQLVELAEAVIGRYGPLLDQVNAERQALHDSGLDRCDSRSPLPRETPQLVAQIDAAMRAADDFCRQGALLTLQRSDDLIAFWEWQCREVLAQYDGAEPTPWPGPF